MNALKFERARLRDPHSNRKSQYYPYGQPHAILDLLSDDRFATQLFTAACLNLPIVLLTLVGLSFSQKIFWKKSTIAISSAPSSFSIVILSARRRAGYTTVRSHKITANIHFQVYKLTFCRKRTLKHIHHSGS